MASATSSRVAGRLRRRSSDGLDRKSNSTSTDGTLGDFSTRKPADRRGAAQQGAPGLQLRKEQLREFHRTVGRAALLHVDEMAGDIRVPFEFEAGDQVGLVLPGGKLPRASVGALLRESVDRRAAGALARHRVGVKRNEQVGARRPPDGDPLTQRQEPVVVARQTDIVFPARGKAER